MRAPASRTGLEKLSVMIINDGRHPGEMLAKLLHGLGVGAVGHAANAPQALRTLAEAKPDVLFIDLSMRGLDSVGFVRALRWNENDPMRHVPIVMIIGQAEPDRLAQARDAGVNEFVVKPITGRAIALRLESLIHRPRPFFRTTSYYGPDRRERDEAYEGEDRRIARSTVSPTLSSSEIDNLLHVQQQAIA